MPFPIAASTTPPLPAVVTSSAVPSVAARSIEKAPTSADVKSQLNANIIRSSFEVSLQSKSDPLALLLKTTITGINEALQPTLGADAIQNAMKQDNTSEATAARIVSLSTGFYEAFLQQNPGKDEASALKDFMGTINRGFEQGYKEATDMLKGMNVFDGQLASDIEKTYALVKQGYADFEAAQSSRISGLKKAAPTHKRKRLKQNLPCGLVNGLSHLTRSPFTFFKNTGRAGRSMSQLQRTSDCSSTKNLRQSSGQPQGRFIHQRDLLAQFENPVLPVARRNKPRESSRECRIIPAPPEPRGIVDQTQGAQGFNEM